MNHSNGLPSFDVASGGLAGFSHPHGTTKPRLDYRGMSVQAVGSPSSVHIGPSHANQNDAHPVNPLNGFHVTSLTQAVPGGFDELDLPVIPESVFDEYVPWNPEKASVDDALLPVQGSCLYNQSLFSGNEPDVSEPAPANRLSPDHHLTDLTTELVNPLSLRQATSDNPANSADSIVDGKSSQVKSQKERQRERIRELRKDPAYAERERERQRERYQNDPVYAERHRERERERQRELRKDPAYAERERERQRERYQNDPVYAERQRERQRELRKDPAHAERERERQRERYQNDPVYAERRRERHRERQRERIRELRKDPAYAEREKERQRERQRELRKDPAYAEGQRIYIKIYSRMKRQNFSKEEASKIASVAKKQYLQSLNSPADSGDILQTSNPAETTQNSNKNLDTLLKLTE